MMTTKLIPFSLDGGIVTLTSITAFLTIVALWYALFERDSSEVRARMLERRRAELEGQTAARQRGRRRRQLTAIVTSVVDRLKLAQANRIEDIREQLSAAGMRSKEALAFYLFASLCSPLSAVLIALTMTSGTHAGFASTMMYLGIAGLIGLLAPRWYVRWRLSRRLARLRRALPDALDLLVICAEAGLSLDSALHRVARELGRASPELADELALIAVELTFLPERRQALRNFARRIPLPAVHALVGTLVQTERYGTPLAQALRVLANELREQRLIKAEEKAARLPAILTVPLIVFILPTLFVVLAGPAFLDIYDQIISR